MWLLKANVRRTDIADALEIPYRDVVLFVKRKGIRKSNRGKGYLRVSQRRKHLKMLAVAMKGGKCEICGYHKSLQGLTFHHPDPKLKEFTISANANRSWATLKKEIQKCRLLCATCHQEQHELLKGPLEGTWWD